jgi:hypothetical protein
VREVAYLAYIRLVGTTSAALNSATPRDDDDVFADSAEAATGPARSCQTFSFPSTSD